jgi:hypothetical protein
MPARFLAFLAALAALAPVPPAGAHGDRSPAIARTLVLAPTGVGGASVAAAGTTACGTRGSEGNLPDPVTAHQTQVIYFVPAGACDQALDGPTLASSMASLNAWLTAQGSKPMRLDRTSTGALDAVFLRGEKQASTYGGVADIASEIGPRGFAASYKRYLIFAAVDLNGTCGEAEYPGSYAAVFLDSDTGCGTRDFGNGTLAGAGKAEVVSGQEAIHNDGIVDLLAPHDCLPFFAHVCTPGLFLSRSLDPETADVMYPFVTGVKLSQKVLDRGHDDYFKTALPVTDLNDSTFFGS